MDYLDAMPQTKQNKTKSLFNTNIFHLFFGIITDYALQIKNIYTDLSMSE